MAAYYLFLLANAMLFIRPQEIVPALGHLPLYLACIAGAIFCAIPQLQGQMRWPAMQQQPVNLCVVGVTVAIFTSLVTTGRLGEVFSSVTEMIKILLYYLVLVSVITTPQRMRTFLMSIALCGTIMISYSVLDYLSFCDYWVGNPELERVLDLERTLPSEQWQILRYIPDRRGVDAYGQDVWGFRLCGLGIFHDPNDLSLLIVAVTILSVYFLTDRKSGATRFLWVLPIGMMGMAMHYTYSRGGLLAFGMGAVAWLCTRYGTKVAIAMGVLGALALPVVMGRAANINLSEGTGQQRIQIWGDGLAAIQNHRVLFGIGEGVYPDVAGYVAHNSFVHAFVELGFFGGTFFFGCFFLPAFTFYLMKRHRFEISDPELKRMFPYIAALLAEWCMGMCSLSRCYVPPTYMVCGVAAAYINLVGFYRPRPRPLLILNAKTAQPWLACSAALLVGAYCFVRVFVRWG